MGLVACGKSNPPELNDAAQKAADTYCDCVKKSLDEPVDGFTKKPHCVAEDKAFDAAWEALPVRGNDKKALAIFNYQHGCTQLLRSVH